MQDVEDGCLSLTRTDGNPGNNRALRKSPLLDGPIQNVDTLEKDGLGM